MWKSPNGTIRNILNGTGFREPIVLVRRGWRKAITIGRNAFGDQYWSTDLAPGPGKLQLIFTPEEGGKQEVTNVYDLKGKGVAMSIYNTDESITGFAHASFKMALQKRIPLFMSTKNTIMKKYDGGLRDIFREIYEKEYRGMFEKEGSNMNIG